MKRLALVVAAEALALTTALMLSAPQLANAQRVGGTFLRGGISAGAPVARPAFAPGRLTAHGLDFGPANPFTGWGTANLERYYMWQNGQVANFYANTGWGMAQPITGVLNEAMAPYGAPAMVPIPGYVNGISSFAAVVPPVCHRPIRRNCARVIPHSCHRVIQHSCQRVIPKNTCKKQCPTN